MVADRLRLPGHGGSLGHADPASGIAFGYVMNALRVTMDPDPRVTALVEALREAMSRQPA